MSAETFYVDISTISLSGTGTVIGGDESQLLVERLLGMYRSWAALQRVEFQQIDLTPAYGGGIRNVKFSLSGIVRSSFAALHDGTHTLICIPPDDLNQRRHMSVVGVRSRNDPELPLPAGRVAGNDAAPSDVSSRSIAKVKSRAKPCQQRA